MLHKDFLSTFVDDNERSLLNRISLWRSLPNTPIRFFSFLMFVVRSPKEKLDKIGQPSLVLGLELLIFRSWQAKRATY
jgi:hypothetical protein